MNRVGRQVDAILCSTDRLLWGGGSIVRLLGRSGWLPSRRLEAACGDGRHWQVVNGVDALLSKRVRLPQAAVVSPEECMFGEFVLPVMRRKSLTPAIQAFIQQRSPLPLTEIQMGWLVEPSGSQGWNVCWGICRTESVERARAQHQLTKNHPVYLVQEAKALLINDSAAQREAWRQRAANWLAYLLPVSLIFSAVCYASVPLWLKRQAVVDAMKETIRLEGAAAPIRGELDRLRRQDELLKELKEAYRDGVSPVTAVEQLTKAMPDDVWLDRIEMAGDLIKISGMANNANDLINAVSKSAVFFDVRAVSPNIRDASAGKDRFSFELRVRAESAQ